MGDMNDPLPNNDNSLSMKLKNELDLMFETGEATCCFNWDSAKPQMETKWINSYGHPDNKINEEAYKNNRNTLNNIKKEKAKLINYAFYGDLIYYSNNDFKGNSQQPLFQQDNKEKTSQYSDHVFQMVVLKDKNINGGGKKKKTMKSKSKNKKRKSKKKTN